MKIMFFDFDSTFYWLLKMLANVSRACPTKAHPIINSYKTTMQAHTSCYKSVFQIKQWR